MSSEGEEPESWSKEDLVIETVRFRSRLRSTCNLLRSLADDEGDAFLYDEGSEPSEKWLNRIVERIMSLKEPGE